MTKTESPTVEPVAIAPDIDLADISWRIDSKPTTGDNPRARYIAYIDVRTVGKYLDLWVGPDAWTVDYQESQIMGKIVVWSTLTIHFPSRTIVRRDLSDNTDAQGPKGIVSDSMKRAAAAFGIGRNVYKLPEIWAPVRVARNGKAYPADGVEKIIIAELKNKGYDDATVAGVHNEPVEHETHDAPASTERSEPAQTPAQAHDDDVIRGLKSRIFVASGRDAEKAEAAWFAASADLNGDEWTDELVEKVYAVAVEILDVKTGPERLEAAEARSHSWVNCNGTDDPKWAVTKNLRREFAEYTEGDLVAAEDLYSSLQHGASAQEPLSQSDAAAMRDALHAP